MKSLTFVRRACLIPIVTMAFHSFAHCQDSLNVTKVGGLNFTSTAATQIAVSGGFAYMISWFSDLLVVDISIPSLPVEICQFTVNGYCQCITVREPFAYIGSEYGMTIVDIADPAAPCTVGEYNTYSNVSDIFLDGDYAYISAGSADLKIVDIANPEYPVEVGGITTSISDVKCATIHDSILFLCDLIFCGHSDIVTYDLTDPINPQYLGGYQFNGHPQAIEITGDLAWVACYNVGVWIVDISIPAFPCPLSSGIYTDSWVWDMDIVGNYACIAADSAGLRIFDISDPLSPVETAYYDTPGCAYGIAFVGDYAYVADYNNLGIYDCSDALPVEPEPESEPLLKSFTLSAQPNPFNPTTTLTFSLPIASKVEFTIFDVSGCRVGVGLAPTRHYTAGTHSITFDGSALSSGLYFVEMRAGDFNAVQKLVLVK